MQQLTAKSGVFLERISLGPHESIKSRCDFTGINGEVKRKRSKENFFYRFSSYPIPHTAISLSETFHNIFFFKVSFLKRTLRFTSRKARILRRAKKGHKLLVFFVVKMINTSFVQKSYKIIIW